MKVSAGTAVLSGRSLRDCKSPFLLLPAAEAMRAGGAHDHLSHWEGVLVRGGL